MNISISEVETFRQLLPACRHYETRVLSSCWYRAFVENVSGTVNTIFDIAFVSHLLEKMKKTSMSLSLGHEAFTLLCAILRNAFL